MSRLPEQRLWDKMRRNLSRYPIRLERVENRVGSGRPDVDALCAGVYTPIELKQVESYPAREKTKVIKTGKGLSVAQRNWAMEWHRFGGQSLIIVGVGSHDVYCFEGSLHDVVNQMTKEDMQKHSIASDWVDIALRLSLFLSPIAKPILGE